MIDQFHDQRQSMEALESKLLATKYDNVHRFSSGAMADYWHGDEFLPETPRDESEWKQMLEAARVDSVHRRQDGSISFPVSVRLGENIAGGVAYEHSQSAESGLQECRDDFSKIPCGHCTVALEEGWWIDVFWYDPEVGEEVRALAADDYHEGLIDLREYLGSADERYDACFADGNRLIGNTRNE